MQPSVKVSFCLLSAFSDYTTAGQIVDNELNALLVRPLLPGATLHAIIDACHSGTVLDLPFHTMTDSYGRFTWKGYARADKASRGGVAFQFGACKDHQVAAVRTHAGWCHMA